MAYCSDCGGLIPNHAKFCGACGSSIGKGAQSPLPDAAGAAPETALKADSGAGRAQGKAVSSGESTATRRTSGLLVGLISVLWVLLWVLVFIATLTIVIESTRDYLQKTGESHAQDTATSLGWSITHSGRVKDVETVERMTAAIFDRGYYREILVKSTDGKVLVAKRVEEAVKDVPDWFVERLSLSTPRMSAIVMDGRRQAATIEVVSHSGHAYVELWRISVRLAWMLLIVAIVSLVVVLGVLPLALRSLDPSRRA